MVSEEISFEHLPPEIREHILHFLDGRSLLSACSVSRTWYQLISPVSSVWYRACQRLGLQIADGIGRTMCRALYVRLAQRWISMNGTCCFITRPFIDPVQQQITAIYYYKGKLAICSRYGTINFWESATNMCLWTSERRRSYVTSIKFDDVVVVASYCNGTIVSLDSLTGRLRRIYNNPCTYAVTVDYMTDADLVVSCHSSIVCWTMSTGNLILVQHLGGLSAQKVVIGPYPDEEANGDLAVRRILVVCRLDYYIVVWLATSTMKKHRGRILTLTILNTILVGCPNRCSSRKEIYLADELYFDGEFLYFTKHAVGECTGIVCQWDIENRRMVTEKYFPKKIRALLGVGKKYMLIITSDSCGDQVEFMDRQSWRVITCIRILKYYKGFMNPDWDIFCLGERSWLDGFDGVNDNGEVFVLVNLPHEIHVYDWSPVNGQRYFPRWLPSTAVNYPQL